MCYALYRPFCIFCADTAQVHKPNVFKNENVVAITEVRELRQELEDLKEQVSEQLICYQLIADSFSHFVLCANGFSAHCA